MIQGELMVSSDNIERLKKAIGIDFDHSHAPINQPLPATGQAQQMPTQQRQQEMPTPQEQMPPVQPKSVLSQTTMPPKPEPHTSIPNMNQDHNHPIQSDPQQPITHPRPQQPIGQTQQPYVPTQKEPTPTPPTNSALFVKIDRHMEITDDILNTRVEMKKMLDTISLLNKAEKLKSEAVEKIEKRLNVFDEKLDNIDSNLVAPKEFSSPSTIPIKAKDADLDNLQSEITKLKTEIDNL